MLHDSLREDPRGLLRKIDEFLGVDAKFLPDSWDGYFNIATDCKPDAVARSRGYLILLLSRSALVGLKNLIVRYGLKDMRYCGVRDFGNSQARAALSQATRRRLSAILQTDLERLDELRGLDLSAWPTFDSRARKSR